MKKLLVVLFLLVLNFTLKAQYPIQQNLGSDSTIIYIKGAARTVGGFINGTYTDTAAANLTRIRQYQAAQIFTTNDSAIWFRMPGATKWVRIMPATPPSPNVDTSYWSLSGNYVADRVATPRLGTTTGHELNIITNDTIRLTIPVYGIRRVTGNENRYLVIDTTIGSNMYVGYMDGGSIGSYTAGNGLTLSGSQFKLGGAFSENTTITNAGGYDFKMYLNDDLETGFFGTNYGSAIGFQNGTVTIYQQSNSLTGSIIVDRTLTQISNIRSGATSTIAIASDSIKIFPHLGNFKIDSLTTVGTTTGRKVLLHDTATGKVERIDPASLVSTYTAGNGLTLSGSQFKWGGTLTENTTITGGDNILDINNTQSSKTAKLLLEDGAANLMSTGGVATSFSAGLESAFMTSLINGEHISQIEVNYDSIILKPHLGNIHIDTLQTISSTTGRKILLHDTATGKVERIDPALLVQQKISLVFGAGSGADADTTAFTTSAIYGSFYNDADTIVVTSFKAVLQGTSPDVTYKIWYNDSLNVEAGATALNTAGNQVTSTTTGTNVTSITNTKIPPGNWVWVKTSTVATKPKYFSLTINGYRK